METIGVTGVLVTSERYIKLVEAERGLNNQITRLNDIIDSKYEVILYGPNYHPIRVLKESNSLAVELKDEILSRKAHGQRLESILYARDEQIEVLKKRVKYLEDGRGILDWLFGRRAK